MKKELVKNGIYQHYKGPYYRVLQFVRHSETLEELVYYETLYPSDMGRFWVRPKAMFAGKVEVNGKQVERFRFVDQSAD